MCPTNRDNSTGLNQVDTEEERKRKEEEIKYSVPGWPTGSHRNGRIIQKFRLHLPAPTNPHCIHYVNRCWCSKIATNWNPKTINWLLMVLAMLVPLQHSTSGGHHLYVCMALLVVVVVMMLVNGKLFLLSPMRTICIEITFKLTNNNKQCQPGTQHGHNKCCCWILVHLLGSPMLPPCQTYEQLLIISISNHNNTTSHRFAFHKPSAYNYWVPGPQWQFNLGCQSNWFVLSHLSLSYGQSQSDRQEGRRSDKICLLSSIEI